MGAFFFLLGLVAVAGFIWYLARPRPPTTTQLVLGAVVAGILVLAVLAWAEVQRWFDSHRVPNSLGEMIRERLAGGDFAVVGNIRRGSAVLATRKWRTKQLDPWLSERFGDTDQCVVYTES